MWAQTPPFSQFPFFVSQAPAQGRQARRTNTEAREVARRHSRDWPAALNAGLVPPWIGAAGEDFTVTAVHLSGAPTGKAGGVPGPPGRGFQRRDGHDRRSHTEASEVKGTRLEVKTSSG